MKNSKSSMQEATAGRLKARRRVLCAGFDHSVIKSGRMICAIARGASFIVALLVVGWVSPIEALELSAPQAAAISQQARFDQNLGATVPLDAVFRDDEGKAVTFRGLLGQRPVVLVLGYHECPMLCSLVLGGVVEALTEMRPTSGKDFDLIDMSISPADDPAAAAKQKRIYFKRYARQGADAGWHFLTSPNAATIREFSDAVGFHYAYDVTSKQYAHPSGLIVLTPEGRVSRYLFGVNFNAGELQGALQAAGERRVSSPIAQLLMVCFHYNPMTGKYGALILGGLRAAGVATLLVMAGGIVFLVRRPIPVLRA